MSNPEKTHVTAREPANDRRFRPHPPKMDKQTDTCYPKPRNSVPQEQNSVPSEARKRRQQKYCFIKPPLLPQRTQKASRKRISRSPQNDQEHVRKKKMKPAASEYFASTCGPQQAAQAVQGINSLSISSDEASMHHKLNETKERGTPWPAIQVNHQASDKITHRKHSGTTTQKKDVSSKHQSLSFSSGARPGNVHNASSLRIQKTSEKIYPIQDEDRRDNGFKKPAWRNTSPSCYSKTESISRLCQHGRCGLFNLGNTCFLNSAIQCMSNTEPLRKYFLPSADGGSPDYINDINKTNPQGTGGAIAKAFGDLLKKMWSGSCGAASPQELKTQISRFAPRFTDFHQQDSQELLAFLLDGLHEDLNRVKEKIYVDSTFMDANNKTDEELAEESWINHLLRNNSKIVDIFQGQLMATVTCGKSNCANVSKICDPFMFLALPIPEERSRWRSRQRGDSTQSYHLNRRYMEQDVNAVDIMDCIELMTDETLLDSWYCTKCKSLVKASRTVDIWKLPEVLIVYFKRFCSAGLYSRSKVTNMVKFPIRGFHLTGHTKHRSADDSVTAYDLFAVSNHHGGIWGGHYTTYAKDLNHTWCKFNDSEVSSISESDVVSEAAYVLFYHRQQHATSSSSSRPQTVTYHDTESDEKKIVMLQ